jgi:hypothetical protein
MNTNPLDRLSDLYAQRTARTQSLWEATQALCARLDKCTESGDMADIGEYSLCRRTIRSRVGESTVWQFASDDWCVVLDCFGPDEHRFMHGDFDCPIKTAGREQLIAFASVASQLVDQLASNAQAAVDGLADATKRLG